MKIELESGRLQLTRGQILKVRDGAGRTVCARQGWIWITEENQPNDIVLEPGGCYRLRRDGVAIVHAVGSNAAIDLA